MLQGIGRMKTKEMLLRRAEQLIRENQTLFNQIQAHETLEKGYKEANKQLQEKLTVAIREKHQSPQGNDLRVDALLEAIIQKQKITAIKILREIRRENNGEYSLKECKETIDQFLPPTGFDSVAELHENPADLEMPF